MVSAIEKAIVKTIIYADIFDYPLTDDEIYKYLVKIKDQRSKIKNTNQKLKIRKVIYEKDGYYFLRGRENIVKERKARKEYSERKIEIARKVATFIKIIPTIKLIGITGALAVNNSKKDDDIDLMIITKNGFLWTTRLFVTLLVELLGIRRRPGDTDTNNKICLNMFVDEKHLSMPVKERDLFSAHEVVQMKPIYDKDKTYEKFLQENLWVEKYLPNGIELKIQNAKVKITSQNSKIFFYLLSFIFYLIEGLLKHLQLLYMRNRRTSEVIADGVIRFHPHDARVWVMKKYDQKISFIQHG